VLPEDVADSKALTVLINQSGGGQNRRKRFYWQSRLKTWNMFCDFKDRTTGTLA